MKRLRGSGRDIPNKRLSIYLRTILPVHDLTVAASTVGRRSFTILSASSPRRTCAHSACTRGTSKHKKRHAHRAEIRADYGTSLMAYDETFNR